MPVEVNHAIEVIFQDYHFKNKVVSVAATPEEEEELERTGGSKSFYCSGVKASFRQDAKTKAFTSYTKKMTKSILRTNVLVLFIHLTLPAISDCVLVSLFNNHYLQSRTMSSSVYS
jgi:hypothetical protein